MTAAEWAELVDAALAACRGPEADRRVWVLARRLEQEWGRL